MTPSERKAFEALSEYDKRPGTKHDRQADKRRWIVREFGPKALDQADMITGLIEKVGAFEAMREALTYWAHSAEDIHRNGKLYTAAEVHRAVMQARAALALADAVREVKP